MTAGAPFEYATSNVALIFAGVVAALLGCLALGCVVALLTTPYKPRRGRR